MVSCVEQWAKSKFGSLLLTDREPLVVGEQGRIALLVKTLQLGQLFVDAKGVAGLRPGRHIDAESNHTISIPIAGFHFRFFFCWVGCFIFNEPP